MTRLSTSSPTRFFTGKPCVRGHIAERLISNNGCVVCQNERKAKRGQSPDYRARRNARLKRKRDERREPRICAVCFGAFDAQEGNRFAARTCSPECGETFYARNRKKQPDKECDHCFAMFASRNPAQRACSPQCRAALEAEQRAARTKPCVKCETVFNLSSDDNGHNGFCSDECRGEARAERCASAYQRLRIHKPGVIVARKARYRLNQPEAFMRTRKTINNRRVAGETAAYEVAKQMIPDALAGLPGYRAKVRASVEFLRSIGMNPSKPTEKTDVPLRST